MLGQSFTGLQSLGDVETRDRLDPADDGVVHHLGDRLDVVQHPVDTEAHQAEVALRLDVDVARAGVEGVV